MTTSEKNGLVPVAVIAASLLTSQAALGGRTHNVLVTDLGGWSEESDSDNGRIAGAPNGWGEACVFRVDGEPTAL